MLEIYVPREIESEKAKATVSFILSEAKKGTKSIGFIPQKGLEYACTRGRVIVLLNNGDRVGFAVFGGKGPALNLYQVWVREDARLVMHGRAMLNHLDIVARWQGKLRLSLWCLEALPATSFWAAMGFERITTRTKSIRPGRVQICWQRDLAVLKPLLSQASSGQSA